MRQSGNKIKGAVQVFGCLSAVLGFSQISHAKSTHRIVHSSAHRASVKKAAFHGHGVIHKSVSHRSAVRHVTEHHVTEHHATERHATERHVAGHHFVEHHATERHIILRHADFHLERNHHGVYRRVASRHHDYRHGYAGYHATHGYIRHAAYLWCVPYARDVSHINLSGDAFLWWAEAAGRYDRGVRPESGAVLNFRSSRRIPLGHVAVVEQVVNNREVLVNQANWSPDQVSHNVPVIDVSPTNNWSEVQVSIGGGRFGSTYPTYGFIYGQHTGGMIYAKSGVTEVAEAPVPHKIRLIAPNRTLR
jgi:hypothetical protein